MFRPAPHDPVAGRQRPARQGCGRLPCARLPLGDGGLPEAFDIGLIREEVEAAGAIPGEVRVHEDVSAGADVQRAPELGQQGPRTVVRHEHRGGDVQLDIP